MRKLYFDVDDDLRNRIVGMINGKNGNWNDDDIKENRIRWNRNSGGARQGGRGKKLEQESQKICLKAAEEEDNVLIKYFML